VMPSALVGGSGGRLSVHGVESPLLTVMQQVSRGVLADAVAQLANLKGQYVALLAELMGLRMRGDRVDCAALWGARERMFEELIRLFYCYALLMMYLNTEYEAERALLEGVTTDTKHMSVLHHAAMVLWFFLMHLVRRGDTVQTYRQGRLGPEELESTDARREWRELVVSAAVLSWYRRLGHVEHLVRIFDEEWRALGRSLESVAAWLPLSATVRGASPVQGLDEISPHPLNITGLTRRDLRGEASVLPSSTGRSVGAASRGIEIPNSEYRILPDQNYDGARAFKRGSDINIVDELVAKHGGTRDGWRMMKKVFLVESDLTGRIVRTEVHWFEQHGVGRFGFHFPGGIDPP
jgi:hypothetical protein